MSVLRHKLRRELWASRGALVAVIAIMAVGTGSYIGSGTAQRILETSQQDYYRAYRFADFWIDLKKVPLSVVERIAEMPEVAAVEPRVVFDVILDLPGVERPLSGRLLSAPAERFGRSINGACLVRGDRFGTERHSEIVLGEAFARAHGLAPGHRIGVILNRKRESFRVAGTAISPEYVYMVRGEAGLLPDPKHFGIMYVEESYAREVLDFQDACNQIIGQLTPQAQPRIESFLERMKETLAPYGVLAATPRSRQPSHRFLTDEIQGLAVSAWIMPGIFLVVAALVLNSLMMRMAERQRTIIGTLKALGWSDGAILRHFLAFGGAVGLCGGVCGCVVGSALSQALIGVYKDFYEFPQFAHATYPDLLIIGLMMSIGFGLLGTVRGVYRVAGLQPAEAMRPRPPARGGRVFLQRWPGLWKRLGFRMQMALRTVSRNRGRTLTGVVSTAMSNALVFLTLSMYVSVTFLVDFQFRRITHSDVDLGLRDEQSAAALFESRGLPGVRRAEPILGVVCDLRNGLYARRISITGLARDHRLTTPLQTDGNPIELPAEGLVLSRKLAELLKISPGQRLDLLPVRGRRDARRVRVAGIVDTYLGLDCYAAIAYLNAVVGESNALNGVQLAVDRGATASLYRTIKQMPNAQGLGVRADAVANIEETLVRTIQFSYAVMILFAGVIALGSTVNNSLMEIGDRLREISTLQVMGYPASHVAGIFLRQNVIVGLAGLLVGVPLGWVAVEAMARAYNTELFRIPVVIHPLVIVATIAIAGLFLGMAQLIVQRHIRRLDFQEGIKVKE